MSAMSAEIHCGCGATFPAELGKHGCPNCEGDGAVLLLRDAIHGSGMSARAFAERVLMRDERTVRRWLAGASPIPAPVVRWLEREAE